MMKVSGWQERFRLLRGEKWNVKELRRFALFQQRREETYGWHNERTKIGWETSGDYETMHTAEAYYMPKDLLGNNEADPNAGDALMGVVPAYLNYDWEDPKFSNNYIWEHVIHALANI